MPPLAEQQPRRGMTRGLLVASLRHWRSCFHRRADRHNVAEVARPVRRRRRNLRGMRRDLELWAIQITTIADWRERSTWFNVRVRDLERQLQALKREAPDVIEDLPSATLGDVRHTLGAMLATMKSIENHLAAMVEMRQRLGQRSAGSRAASHKANTLTNIAGDRE